MRRVLSRDRFSWVDVVLIFHVLAVREAFDLSLLACALVAVPAALLAAWVNVTWQEQS